MRSKWYWSGGGLCIPDIPNNTYDSRNFVSLDSEKNVLGYISYRIDWFCMRAYQFGIIGFEDCSVLFAKDVYQTVIYIFEKYNMNAMEWEAYVGNPAIRGYRHLIEKHGGRQCGYYRKRAMLMDGKIYDSVAFEILVEEFHR